MQKNLMDLLAEQQCDIVLLDIAFGKADGRELCQENKKGNPPGKAIGIDQFTTIWQQ
ncbi:MAG: hypothetical protein KL787_08590 [Taibaiella sp.]|nr:hypothetical protein [Taibaiella sp.]